VKPDRSLKISLTFCYCRLKTWCFGIAVDKFAWFGFANEKGLSSCENENQK
jgi:hypothetical protein